MNRITDDIKKEYVKEFLEGLSAGFNRNDAKSMALHHIRVTYLFDSRFTQTELGSLGSAVRKLSKPIMKVCRKCHKEKTLDNFNKNLGSPDGLQSYCKECANEYYRVRSKTDRKAQITSKPITLVCTTCHVEKNVDEFYKNRSKKSGFQSYCKECSNKRNAQSRLTYKEQNRTEEVAELAPIEQDLLPLTVDAPVIPDVVTSSESYRFALELGNVHVVCTDGAMQYGSKDLMTDEDIENLITLRERANAKAGVFERARQWKP